MKCVPFTYSSFSQLLGQTVTVSHNVRARTSGQSGINNGIYGAGHSVHALKKLSR